MPFRLIRNDITKMRVDAIVNAANNSLLGGGGVDGAIHRAAGPQLLAECRALGGCATGDAKITRGYRLPCKYVIQTVGPIWRGGRQGEREALASCYRRSLQLAAEHGCQSVAFPLISAGVYGYPKDQAMQVAAEAIRAFLQDHEMTVWLVIFDRGAFAIGSALYREIAACIDDAYVAAHTDTAAERARRWQVQSGAAQPLPANEARPVRPAPPEQGFGAPAAASFSADQNQSLRDALRRLDESFSQMLLRKIDEAGMTDAECYKRANISRKLFSKIRSDAQYRPSKPTALAFAIALRLPLDETQELLRKAGFALSHASKFDIIVEYFIARGNYDIFAINEALFAFDQSLLGG